MGVLLSRQRPSASSASTTTAAAAAATSSISKRAATDANAGRLGEEALDDLLESLRGLEAERPRQRPTDARRPTTPHARRALPQLRERVEACASNAERAAIGAIVRKTQKLACIVELLDYSSFRLDALRILCSLSSSRYDAHADESRRAMHSLDVMQAVRPFIYLSPMAQSSGVAHEGGLAWLVIKAEVFYAMGVLANLTTRPEHARILEFSGCERLREIAASADEAADVRLLPCRWAGAVLGRMAALCLRNVAAAAEAAPTEHTDPDATERPTLDHPLPPPPPPTAVAEPARRPHSRGFHDVSALVRLLERLPAYERAAAGEADVCTVCLEEMRPGEVCRALPCAHTFHALCIEKWLTAQLTSGPGCCCPNCKRALRVHEMPDPEDEDTEE